MRDEGGFHKQLSFLFVVTTLALAACSDRGDLGRHSPSLISRTWTGSLDRARLFLGREEDYDLPLTAAEDALRIRARDMQAISYSGLISQVIPARSGDGFYRVQALIEDLKVERQRFDRFCVAARKVMKIDDARRERLAGLDALTARRQQAVARERRGENDRLIRNAIRLMRRRSGKYRQLLARLPVELPQVPLAELQGAHEAFHEEIVRCHAMIDQHAHRWLGRSRLSLK